MTLPSSIVDNLAERSKALSCDDQFALAERIAGNVGYVLVREDDMRVGVMSRVEHLEKVVSELNPGALFPLNAGLEQVREDIEARQDRIKRSISLEAAQMSEPDQGEDVLGMRNGEE